jgi:hypothetical protein
MGVRLSSGIVSDGHIQISDADYVKLPYRTVGNLAPTNDGGEISLGVRRRGRDERTFLVHLSGRRQQAIALEAVAAAIQFGILPRDQVEQLLAEGEKHRDAIEREKARLARLAKGRRERAARARERWAS